MPDRLAPFAPAWVTQLVFALLCTALAIASRLVADRIAPGAGPFALGFPPMLIATLFARWPAGLITSALTILYGWYFVLPHSDGPVPHSPGEVSRLLLTVIIYGMMLLIAESFRRAVRSVTQERDRQLAERDLFLEEFDHRVKNNFAVVASLLDLQRRRAHEPATKEALGIALSRVESIARAHRHLYRGGAGAAGVEIRVYIEELCAALSEALLLRGAITLTCQSESLVMPRDRAVSIGLVINELVTNAAKHAFPGRDRGHIEVTFDTRPGGWRLTVRDDGVGMAGPMDTREGGLGRRLIDAFARQAHGTLTTQSDERGTRVTLDLEP